LNQVPEGFPVLEVNPIIDQSVRELCTRPYPLHPKGCPNFGQKDTCPPKAKMFFEVFDPSYPVYAIVNAFDYRGHKEQMRAKHPEWSERQLACVRFWQGKARKQLKLAINMFLSKHENYAATTCPEALGVNVTETLKNAGIIMEWPPKEIAYQVALAGKKKTGDC